MMRFYILDRTTKVQHSQNRPHSDKRDVEGMMARVCIEPLNGVVAVICPSSRTSVATGIIRIPGAWSRIVGFTLDRL